MPSNISKLGVGTIWMGRRWPVDNKSYKYPKTKEVNTFLKNAYSSGIRIYDTAPAYGTAEARLGMYFKNNPKLISDSFIATKWGEEFNIKTEESTVMHSVEHLNYSLKRSLKLLPKIDLLYIHRAHIGNVLDSKAIKDAMEGLKASKVVKYVGASISQDKALEKVINEKLFWFDYIQVSSTLVWQNETILQSIFDNGITIVVNSPARSRPGSIAIDDAYRIIADKQYVSVVLTGTRNHLEETINYFK